MKQHRVRIRICSLVDSIIQPCQAVGGPGLSGKFTYWRSRSYAQVFRIRVRAKFQGLR